MTGSGPTQVSGNAIHFTNIGAAWRLRLCFKCTTLFCSCSVIFATWHWAAFAFIHRSYIEKEGNQEFCQQVALRIYLIPEDSSFWNLCSFFAFGRRKFQDVIMHRIVCVRRHASRGVTCQGRKARWRLKRSFHGVDNRCMHLKFLHRLHGQVKPERYS